MRRENGTGAKKSDVTRQRILDAAAKVFRARSYSGIRLIDIAEVAEMKTGSLYCHFDSRERLVAEVMAIGLTQTVDAFKTRGPLARSEVASSVARSDDDKDGPIIGKIFRGQ